MRGEGVRVGVKMRQQNELTKKGIGVGGVGVGWEMKRDNRTGMKFDLFAGSPSNFPPVLFIPHNSSFFSSPLRLIVNASAPDASLSNEALWLFVLEPVSRFSVRSRLLYRDGRRCEHQPPTLREIRARRGGAGRGNVRSAESS